MIPSTAFLLITINCSALCIKKDVNLWHNISSISSACDFYFIKYKYLINSLFIFLRTIYFYFFNNNFTCLILIETLTELIDGSIKHLSFSVLATIKGFNNNSLFPLCIVHCVL